MRIAFLLPKIILAGGIYIVLEHAKGLAERHEHDVTVILTRDTTVRVPYPSLDHVRRVGIEDAARLRFDLAIATKWETAYTFPRIEATRHAHFLQNLEDRFNGPHEVAIRARARAIQTFPVSYITTAGWLERQMRALRPDAAVYCVRSGIDKNVFSLRQPTPTAPDAPLRVVIEGHEDVWFKGVPEAMDAVERMNEPHHLTVITGDRDPSHRAETLADRVEGRLSHEEMSEVLGSADVLLKLSRVEGMAGPPLEAFHRGATAVLTPVTGHDEYAVHGVNCQIVGFDDVKGTARALDLLARDRDLLHELRLGAVATASRWPDWEASTANLATVLQEIAEAPPAASPEFTRALIRETDATFARLASVRGTAPYRSRPSLAARLEWVFRREGVRGIASRGVRKLRLTRRHRG